jgi:hypothetical protein
VVRILRRFCCIALVAMTSMSGDPGKVVTATHFCCTDSFEYSEVKAFVLQTMPKLSGRLYSQLIVPESKRNRLFFAGSSEKSASSCFVSAVRIQNALSHAYLLKTPLGVGLHYWNAQTKSYRATVLSGRDVYGEVLAGGRIAWIGLSEMEVPQVWLVSDSSQTMDKTLLFAKMVLGLLGLTDGDVYVRADPYLWRPDGCGAITTPMQLRGSMLVDETSVSHVTAYCRIRAGLKSESCVMYRSR